MGLLFKVVSLCLLVLSCGGLRVEPQLSVESVSVSSSAININTATVDELQTLPNIGPTLARRIVEFREKNGRFRKPEHLLLVSGIGEKRFREISGLVRTE